MNVTYLVFCPNCHSQVPLPDDEPDDPIKVTVCGECGSTFDYDPEDIKTEED